MIIFMQGEYYNIIIVQLLGLHCILLRIQESLLIGRVFLVLCEFSSSCSCAMLCR